MRLLALTPLLLSACATTGVGTPSGDSWPPSDAATGLRDAQLADLYQRHWMFALESDPLEATQLGVHRFDDRLPDNSAPAIAARRAQNARFLEEARALAASAQLSPSDATALRLLTESLEGSVASQVCAFEEWSLSAFNNPINRWNYFPELHPLETPRDGENLIARYRQIATHIDQEVANLRRGLARGLVANGETTRRVIEMVKKQLAQPLAEWPLLDPLKKDLSRWPADRLTRFRAALPPIVEREIKPALERYLTLVEQEISPRARSGEQVGLAALPIGEACYRARVRHFTTLEREPSEIHAIGLEEIARIDQELAALGAKALGATDLASTLAKLRGDPSLFFDSPAAVEAEAKSALDRARAKIPEFFGVLPRADCVVTRIPEYEAPYSTIAYYRAPIPDGTKPGQYYVNVHRPETRPRFEAAVLAYHESIPGHHLQIAIAQELPEMPAFRKHNGPDAFTEGWALYTERLAEEMALYDSDLDRLGVLSFDAWRAARLVVDTGLHALGWSRERAIEFMLAHTALAPNNIDNEVDRYLSWPGQALAYKTGQLEILRLRREAQEKLGAAFSIKQFHDAVLGGGAVSLPILRDQVAAYVAGGGPPKQP